MEAIKDHTNANRDLKDLASRLGLQVSSDEQLLDKARKLMLQVQEGDSSMRLMRPIRSKPMNRLSSCTRSRRKTPSHRSCRRLPRNICPSWKCIC